MKKGVDKCEICVKGDATWLVLDDTWHVYHALYLDGHLQPQLKTRRQQDGYLVCDVCKRQVIRSNKPSPRRRRRLLEFIEWPL